MGFKTPNLFLSTITLVSILYTVDALKCYKCVSYELEMCADYFNQTEIRRRMIYGHNFGDAQMPKEVDCTGDSHLSFPILNQRAVCVKKVESEYGRKKYTRQCMFINQGLTTLECPQDPSPASSRRTLESCDVCDTDLCNNAPSLYSMKNLLLLPLIALFLRI